MLLTQFTKPRVRKIIFVVDNANSFTSRTESSRFKETFPPGRFFLMYYNLAHQFINSMYILISNAVQFRFQPGDNFLFLFSYFDLFGCHDISK